MDTSYYEAWLLYSGHFIQAISILTLVYGFTKWPELNKSLKIYLVYLFLFLCLNSAEPSFLWSLGRNPEFWHPIVSALNLVNTNFFRYPFQLLNFTLLGWFLYRILKPQPAARWISGVSLLLLVATTVNFFFIEGPSVAGGFNSAVNAGYCFVLPLISMWYIYSQGNKVPLVRNPYFWINIGLIMPNIIGFFLYLTGDFLSKENYPLFAQLSIGRNGLECIAQALTALGFSYARNVKFLDSF